jgi:hypothetical protein
MTRDEIRGLIGGYATGSLSEAERRILFEAALEDQDLFDELAREQALKEALEEPGAKARLASALEHRPKPWWRMSWVWAAATAAAVVVIAGIVVMRPSAKVEQVARLEVPELPAPPAPLPAPPPASTVAPPARKFAAAAPEAAPQAAPQAKAEVSAAPEPQPQPPKEAPAAGTRVGTGNLPAPPAPPEIAAQAPQIVVPGAQGFAQGNVGGFVGAPGAEPQPVAPAAAAPAVGGRGGGGRGGGGGGGGRGGGAGARALAQPQAARPARFAFDYTVTQQFELRVLPYANGFLSVNVTKATTSESLFSGRPIQAGSVTEVQLPEDAVFVSVLFSAQETPPAIAGNIIGGSDPLSGTKSDPNPSPNSALFARILLRP